MTDPTIERATAYQGETQLLSWSESDKGRRVTLMLDQHVGEHHPFKQFKHGRRFMVVAVLIGDDESPEPVCAPAEPAPRQVTPVSPTSTEKERRRFSELPRSQQAALKLQDDAFCKWLMTRNNYEGLKVYNNTEAFLKAHLNIISKKDLDRWEEAGANWDKLLTEFDVRHYR